MLDYRRMERLLSPLRKVGKNRIVLSGHIKECAVYSRCVVRTINVCRA